MTFMNNNANIKQFQLIKFLNENVNDDHVISRISIVLRRDKLEAPYYMNTKIRLSSCLDNGEKGLIHAMNILNHSRMYNLTEDRYNEIKSFTSSLKNSRKCWKPWFVAQGVVKNFLLNKGVVIKKFFLKAIRIPYIGM